jgi:hypothetical protein
MRKIYDGKQRYDKVSDLKLANIKDWLKMNQELFVSF